MSVQEKSRAACAALRADEDAAEGCGLEDGMRERRGGLDDGAIDRRKENNGI